MTDRAMRALRGLAGAVVVWLCGYFVGYAVRWWVDEHPEIHPEG